MQQVLARPGKGDHYGATVTLDGMDLEKSVANGAGNSTALGPLTVRLPPDEGTAAVLGGDSLEPARRHGIGVMLQEAALPDTLQMREHMGLLSS